jgi:hypothetical protein
VSFSVVVEDQHNRDNTDVRGELDDPAESNPSEHTSAKPYDVDALVETVADDAHRFIVASP